MRVLITGGSGLIGGNLARASIAAGHEVRVLVRASSDTTALRELPLELVTGDIRDFDAVSAAVSGCELVFHTAVQFAYGAQAHEAVEPVALIGTENIIKASSRAGTRRVVVTSSSVIFGYSAAPAPRDETADLAVAASDPPYVRAKVQQARRAVGIARETGIELVQVCPTMCVGGHGASLGPSNAIITGYLGDPWRRTFPGGCNIVSAWDVAQGHLIVATHGKDGHHYLLGSENLEWSQIHAMIAELGGVPPPGIRLNHSTSYLLAAAEELRAKVRGESPIITREQAGMLGRYYWYNHAQAASLGYAPRPARAALAEAIAWLASSPHVSREMRANMHLHADVYAARRQQQARERLFSSAPSAKAV